MSAAATVAVRDWWARPREENRVEWISNYQKSLQVRHRTVIAEIVADLKPTSLLELAAHCGPNLMRLAKENPQLSCLGIDVNAQAIEAGNQWAGSEGLKDRVQLKQGDLTTATSQMDNQCVDVVLTCYGLGYIDPADLDAMLYECGRLARKAVIIAEPMVLDGTGSQDHGTVTGYREWIHDYQSAAKWIGTLRETTMRVVPVSPPVDRLNAVLVFARA